MATITLRRIEAAYTVSGNNPYTLVHPEAANQTYKNGAILVRNASGHVIEATSPNPVSILGVAEADALNDAVAANSNARINVANDDTVFRANVSTAQVTALTDLGGIFGLIKVGTLWHIDKTAVGTSGRVIIVGYYLGEDVIGDIQGRLLFIFSQRFSALSSTS